MEFVGGLTSGLLGYPEGVYYRRWQSDSTTAAHRERNLPNTTTTPQTPPTAWASGTGT